MTYDVLALDLLAQDQRQQELFAGWLRVHRATGEAIWGPDHSAFSAAEFQSRRRGTIHRYVDRVLADGAEVVGMLSLALPLHDHPQVALMLVEVDPAHRGRGHGQRLVERGEALAAEHGRSVVWVNTESAGDDDTASSFARHRGYALAQTTIRSEMTLPAAEGGLRARAGDDSAYRIDTSWDGVPESWLDGLALLESRMVTDAPQGDLDVTDEHWDADRVREEFRWALDSGRRLVIAMAWDTAGAAVGFTQVQLPADDPTLAYQQDTLVLREARGHRLGIRLKARAALELMRDAPEVRRVRTWNADDNAPMLRVNAELGYEASGYQRAWQKDLAR